MAVALTTVDNPFSPFDDFKAWYAWDIAAGYHTCALLGRIAMTSDDMSEADQEFMIEKAIDEIVSENVTGKFRKLVR